MSNRLSDVANDGERNKLSNVFNEKVMNYLENPSNENYQILKKTTKKFDSIPEGHENFGASNISSVLDKGLEKLKQKDPEFCKRILNSIEHVPDIYKRFERYLSN